MAINPARIAQNAMLRIMKASGFRISDAAPSTTTDYAEIIAGDGAPSGGYGRAAGCTMVYLRKDASSASAAVYITVDGGTTWVGVADSPSFTEVTATTFHGSLDGVAAGAASATIAFQMSGTAVFLSTEQTGTGGPQNVAHGFGAVPVLAFAIPSDLTGGAYAVSYGAHDGTNVVVTVTNGEKYRVVAHR